MNSRLSRMIALGLILGACVMAFAGAAHAATFVNLYGTNEEYNFWQNEGKVLLTALGCNANPVKYNTSDGKSGVIVGVNCPTALSSDNGTQDGYIYFSFTNKASWDGIDAVNNVYDINNWGTYNPGTGSYINSTPNPCGANNNQRQVATCLGGTCGANATYTCQAIHIGVSNLEASAITQSTYGTLKGPLDPTDGITYRQFPTSGPSVSNLPTSVTVPLLAGGNKTYPNPTAPLAYPFAFYVNPGVTTTRCNASSPTAADINNFCVDDTSCGGTATVAPFSYCVSQPIDNLSRLQVVALFSGSITNWSDFGGTYANKPVTLCLRHAGAGTHSVLDVGIMQGNQGGWGATLVQFENRANTASPPYIYFNDLVGDELNCLTWSNGAGPAGSDTLAAGEQGGGVGYADADNPNTANYVEIKYNGVTASRVSMRDGIYDNFWTMDRLYVPSGLSTAVLTVYGEMLTLVGNPANITNATVGSPRGSYYGSTNELNFPKTTSIFYPNVYIQAPDAQTP